MSWAPQDLVSDQDLVDYESRVLTQFGATTWQARRTKALEDWLFPILRGRGFDPHRLKTRYECDGALGFTGAAYTSHLDATRSTTQDDLNLATVFTTAGSDALYLGSKVPFRGFYVRMGDSVSTAAAVMTVAYWANTWRTLPISDKTVATNGKTLSGGGAVTWQLPEEWMVRNVNGEGPFYWVKVTVSATPTGAKADQIGTIRASALRAPATFRTLMLIMREAPTGGDGPWLEKAEFYKDEADQALQRALAIVGGEFDTIDESELIDEEEAAQTPEEASDGGGWRLERA